MASYKWVISKVTILITLTRGLLAHLQLPINLHVGAEEGSRVNRPAMSNHMKEPSGIVVLLMSSEHGFRGIVYYM